MKYINTFLDRQRQLLEACLCENQKIDIKPALNDVLAELAAKTARYQDLWKQAFHHAQSTMKQLVRKDGKDKLLDRYWVNLKLLGLFDRDDKDERGLADKLEDSFNDCNGFADSQHRAKLYYCWDGCHCTVFEWYSTDFLLVDCERGGHLTGWTAPEIVMMTDPLTFMTPDFMQSLCQMYDKYNPAGFQLPKPFTGQQFDEDDLHILCMAFGDQMNDFFHRNRYVGLFSLLKAVSRMTDIVHRAKRRGDARRFAAKDRFNDMKTSRRLESLFKMRFKRCLEDGLFERAKHASKHELDSMKSQIIDRLVVPMEGCIDIDELADSVTSGFESLGIDSSCIDSLIDYYMMPNVAKASIKSEEDFQKCWNDACTKFYEEVEDMADDE